MPSPPLTSKGWGSSDQVPVTGQMPSSIVEVSKVAGLEVSLRRSAELPLAILLIYVRSPLVQDVKRPSTMLEDERRGCFGTEGEEDSLFAYPELALEAVSPVLRDSDLRRVDALSVEDVLALSFQGVATVRSDAFIFLSYL